MNLSAIRVKGARLCQDLVDLARFGQFPGKGLMRTALADADLEARLWFKERMREAGLQVREDAAANLIGRLGPAGLSTHRPCVATGSHIDTVPHGGQFDGALGICAGLEALRAIGESGLSVPCPLELLVFTDEEGAHFAGTFGSRAMFGLLAEGEMTQSKEAGQPSLAQSLRRVGKDPGRIGEAIRSPSEFRSFLELHIEQGPALDSMGIPIGIVNGIVFIDRYRIHVEGEAGHAGTIPMDQRDDALVKAARIITAVNEAVRSTGSDVVGTIGELKIHPGAFNIIPGQVEMFLDLRSRKRTIHESVRKAIGERVQSVERAWMELILAKDGVSMDPGVMENLERSCRQRGIHFTRIWSGAGHDSMTFPTQGIPTGMIFIPCLGGKSHCPEEAIRLEDAVLGAQILADTVMRMALGSTG